MPEYYTNDLRFDLPEGFTDKTAHRLFSTLPGADGVALTVTRAPLHEQGLLEGVRRFLEIEAQRHERFEVGDVRAAECGDRSAVLVAHRFRLKGRVAYQRTLHVADGATWLRIAAMGPAESIAACDRRIDEVATTLRFREGGASG